MFYLMIVATTALVFPNAGRSDDNIPFPKGASPVHGTALASVQDKLLKITLTCPRLRWQVVGEMIPKKEWPRLQVEVEKDTRTLVFGGPSALSDSRVVDLKGKDLSRENILIRLEKQTPVLVSVSGDMLDPYYLQLSKPDTLIVILGPRDGSPDPSLLPAAKPRTDK